jgi:hypothetical protein
MVAVQRIQATQNSFTTDLRLSSRQFRAGVGLRFNGFGTWLKIFGLLASAVCNVVVASFPRRDTLALHNRCGVSGDVLHRAIDNVVSNGSAKIVHLHTHRNPIA